MPAGTILNVFSQDAFSSLTLTRLVNKYPFIPQFLGSFGEKLFTPSPIMTTGYALDRLQGIVSLIPTTPRGGPPDHRIEEKRDITYFTVPRLARKTKVRADELQDVRDYNDPQQLMQLQTMIARKLTGPTGLTRQLEMTWENHRLGAVFGIVLDANGAPIVNYFTKLNITPPTPINFNLTNATPTDGVLRAQLNALVRNMKRAAQGAFIENQTRVIALCGDTFYDDFINHPDIVTTYKNWFAAQSLRENTAFGTFRFGGIEWVNYRGTDDNVTVAIGTNDVGFFLLDAPGVYEVAYAPGETFEDVNKPGEPMYLYPLPDPSGKNAFIEFELNSFPLFVCTRPETIQFGIRQAGDATSLPIDVDSAGQLAI